MIGTDEAINDQIATQWAARFYKGLGAGLSVQRAFDDAVDEVRMSPQSSTMRGVGTAWHLADTYRATRRAGGRALVPSADRAVT